MPQDAPEMQPMQLSNYVELKEKGIIAMQKIGVAFGMAKRQFNPETGEEVDPRLIQINRGSVADMVKSLDAQQAAIDAGRAEVAALLADMDALDQA